MSEAIAEVNLKEPHHKAIIAEIRELWDFWDSKEVDQNDGRLQFDHSFLAPYFGCYRCKDTKKALLAIDMDNDGYVDWTEFLVYIKWALHQYPTVETADETLEIAFQKGLLPAMRDLKAKNAENHTGFRHLKRKKARQQRK